MSIKRKLNILIAILFSFFALVYFVSLYSYKGNKRAILTYQKHSKELQHKQVLAQLKMPLVNFARLYSKDELLKKFFKKPSQEVWKREMVTLLSFSNIQYFWLCDRNLSQVFRASASGLKDESSLTFSPQDLKSILDKGDKDTFFIKRGREVIEVAWAPILSEGSAESSTPKIEGFLLVGVRWDTVYLQHIAALMQGNLTTLNPEEAKVMVADTTAFEDQFSIPIISIIYDLFNRPLLAYRLDFDALGVGFEVNHGAKINALGMLFLGCALLIFCFFILNWVISPLHHLVKSLENRDVSELASMLKNKNEWGNLSQLIKRFFQQEQKLIDEIREKTEAKEALEESEQLRIESIHQREQIAKDLHDSIIQEIYATNLQLSRAVILLDSNVEKSKDVIEYSQTMLNLLSRNMRHFISGLAPEQLQGNNLKEGLKALCFSLQKGTSIKIILEAEDSASESLEEKQSIHLFHIAHELISNAIRHSQGSEIKVQLYLDPEDAHVFSISDDGVGGADVNSMSGGMRNLQDRVKKIGALLTIKSERNEGSMFEIKIP